MKRAALVPLWAWQFVIGIVVVLLAVSVFAVVVGAALRVPSGFLDDVGKAISRVAPQPAPDIATEDQLKKVIVAMPQGKLRVATIDAEHGRVVIVPTGIPGLIDQLQRAMDDLKKKWFGQ